ncbi:MAG TPA: PSD1 and planctomycete cytochrome C domain-containing protein [Chthoniobacteraceae bacterium]|jgi:hypothetical protein|nr:PSD1 and planctomycete cytochrome C domain-containing protein [Chthoniobacteraceae bacterium]
MSRPRLLSLTLALATWPAALFANALVAPVPKTIEFNRDVRPILSENCFKCHGFDAKERKAERRLDNRDGAYAEHDNVRAVVPGDLKASDLWERINTKDADDQMPPPKSGKHLTDRDRQVLKLWIEQGAPYQDHWAYIKPAKAEVPAGAHPVDTLVGRRLAAVGLKPSPEADRRTLIRRLSLDLTGMPPTFAEAEAFVADQAPDAYERLVDRLLASPHYGERMAVPWLDVVRFADTIGYHSDTARNVWPYRDYVIAAFNNNKPFDKFTVEQLAGDLLPGSTQEQQVASCFNRLLLSTEEGGAQAKDYEQRMLTDRVRAVSTVWLAATIGCAQCHDHKFDPITSRDFYSLGAFFADIKEPIIGAREPGLSLATPEQEKQRAGLAKSLAAAQVKLDAPLPGLLQEELEWESKLTAQETAKFSRELKPIAALPLLFRTPAQKAKMLEEYRNITPRLTAERQARDAAKGELDKLEKSIPKVLVSIHADTPRTVRILPRGNWMVETGEIVQPALPQFLPGTKPAEGQRLTRLDLAQWIASKDNPLTARVFVNRLWKQFFGMGLSKVLDDLGAQGEPPVHAEVLDWLASDFMDSGWDIKHVVRAIVTSQTYRQVSTASPELVARDPFNRELARQGRWRLDAEFVRDNALVVAGLLVPTIGGPSVKPYQPDGYWENLNFPVRTYDNSTGPDQYRRGLYTWWQRSFTHPSMLAFDAPTREECAADRNRSNIPQQALALLNDPTYVEAARNFALRILRECKAGDEANPAPRLAWAIAQALQRPARPEEIEVLSALYKKGLEEYRADPAAAEALAKLSTLKKPDETLAPETAAAWTNVARAILNLHETITRS